MTSVMKADLQHRSTATLPTQSFTPSRNLIHNINQSDEDAVLLVYVVCSDLTASLHKASKIHHLAEQLDFFHAVARAWLRAGTHVHRDFTL